VSESGSPFLSTIPEAKSTTAFNPYVGLRYDFDKNFGVEGRVTQSKDFKTVGSLKATANTEISDGIFLNASVGVDKSSNLTGVSGTIGIKINF
jgi:outer membrane autotransporter protein